MKPLHLHSSRRVVVAASLMAVIALGWGCKDGVESPEAPSQYEPAVIQAAGTAPAPVDQSSPTSPTYLTQPPPSTPSASAPTSRTPPSALPNPAADGCEPYRDLAQMDHRTPVPLQPMMAWHQKQNMMEHLVAIQRITDGLARDDWDEVAEASALIESSPQMQQMCRHMGAGADGFTELALEFHRRADRIGEAAEARDQTAALAATSHTLQACTSCHAAYRQELVDAHTWQERTGSSHQPESAPHH